MKMTETQPVRPLEDQIDRDLAGRMTYADYLKLDTLLSAQYPLGAEHDEMLFIIQHQVAELWFKLILHELRAARSAIMRDTLDPCEKILSRVKCIERQLFDQWSVLETLTPSDYAKFRPMLGPASGLQSYQYRTVEFILGNKQKDVLQLFAHDPKICEELRRELESPSLYDEFQRYLARHGHAVPQSCLSRDWSAPYVRNPALVPVFERIYAEPSAHWPVYALCEKLIDIDELFQLWRFRHVKTVERIIGFKKGTGGSSGVAFLRRIVDYVFFPELLDVRTRIGSA
ncbi:tryptophan 2,3-dioxygenase (plasmid) [Methylocystis iwaonis]|uniref:Tryptophan 2,3-dioxygenase n=2 Tax=Methylocystis iwaonis TaxID=2885079 RepID=A0ABM8EDG2_9HYPH|nr:tryptophan 2,3-dioxygenase [Methylocystis iwaonis]